MSSAGDLTGALIAEKYELLRLIGRGGMGAVYEARNVTTLKRCAIKLLLTPELAGDDEVVKRFFREAKASGLIESEHVVAAFDSGIDAAGHVYYVMESLRGEDLEQTLGRLGQLNPQAAIKIILQAANGLASAHALGIVHRDVKPANLFLALNPGDEIKVKILDFGVAKVKMEVFNESISSLTQTGSLLGTPLYMSPEQLRRASSIDDSADVWSLGVVLFECLTGQLPWGNCEGIGELVAAILTERVPLIQDLAPWVTPGLAEVVQRALSRDPAQRLQTAAELRDAISKLVDGDPRLHLHELTPPDDRERRSLAPRLAHADTTWLGPTPVSGAPVVTTLPTVARRNPLPSFAMGAVAFAGAATWFFLRQPDPAPLSALVTPAQRPASTTSAMPTPPAPQAPSAAPLRLAKFALEAIPPRASVTLDGAHVPVAHGLVVIEGPIGSVHAVRITLGKHTTETRVAITHDGLLPSRVELPSGGSPSPPTALAPASPEQKVQVPVAEPASSTSAPSEEPPFEQRFE